jgi:uncharacterized coiled-coil protein SlyX
VSQTPSPAARPAAKDPAPPQDYAAKKRDEAEQRKKDKARKVLEGRIAELETRVAEAEARIKALEAQMAEPSFYTDAAASKAALDEHQGLMWKVGELLGQWEMLTAELEQNR